MITTDSTTQLPMSGKVLAWLSMLLGSLTVLSPVFPGMPPGEDNPNFRATYFVLLGLASLLAGIDGLRRSARAFYVLWYVYAIQTVSYASATTAIDFMSPYSIVFGFGDQVPASYVGVNFLAVAACFVALYNARFLARSLVADRAKNGNQSS